MRDGAIARQRERSPAGLLASMRPSRIIRRRAARSASAGIVRDDDHARCRRRCTRSSSSAICSPVALIELAGRFVGQQQARTVGERTRDRDALHLAARELRRPVVGAVREADVVEQFARARAGVRLGDARLRLRQLDVFGQPSASAAGRSAGTRSRCSRRRRSLRSDVRQRADVAGRRKQRARGRHVDAAEDVQQRRLAAARRSADRRDTRRRRSAATRRAARAPGRPRIGNDLARAPRAVDERRVHPTPPRCAASRRSAARATSRIG